MSGWLHGLGRFSARHHWLVIACWVIVALGVMGGVRTFGAETSNDLELPGTGSQELHDLLSDRFPPQQNGTNPIVFHVDSGKLTDKSSKAAVKSSVQDIRKAPHVYSVTNPVSSNGQTAGLLSKDGRTAFAPVLLDIGSGDLDEDAAQRVFDATKPAQRAEIQVEAAGSIGSELSAQPTETSELVGILAAMLILTIVLGSLVAMGLPIVTAVMGLAIALGIVGLLGHLVSMPDTGATIATMIGLGVGIDYALFLISRHLQQLASGMPVLDSVAKAVATSGSAIVFAGGTVVVALLSLRVAGIPLMSTLGLASAVAVVTAVLAAISLLPALLGLVGNRITWLHLPRRRRRHAATGPGAWARWARLVGRRPVAVTLVALALLVPLIAPAFALQFGQEDIGATPESTTERRAYDLITLGFGVGYNGPLQVASSFDPVVAPSQQYTTKYDKATSLQKDLQQKQKQLPKQQQHLEDQQQQLQAQQQQLTAEGDQLQAQQAQLTTEGDQLQAQQAQLEDQAAQLQAEQQPLEAQEAALKGQQATLERQAATLGREGAELRAEESRLEAQQRALEAEKAGLQQQRGTLRREAGQLAVQLRAAGRDLVGILARERILEQRIADLGDDPVRQAILQVRLDALRQREQEVRTEIGRLEQRARELAREARRLAARAAQLPGQARQLQEQADALQAQARRLQTRADALQPQKQALERQAAALQRRADQLEAEGASLERQGAGLQQQADELQAEGAALQQQGDELQAEGAALQQQGDELQKQADDLKKQQQQAKDEQQQAEQLQKQLTTMVTAAGGDPRNTDPRVVELQDALSDTDGVASLTPPQTNKNGDVVLLSAVPTTGPATQQTTRLLDVVRTDVLPKVESQAKITSYVGGYTASYVDLAGLISNRLLLVIGTVILLGFLLLMVAFRSVLIPLQAAVTNLLSAAAAFGILTAVFQWGWGTALVGIDTSSSGVPVASYVPLMMFAVLFGLSMDYEVFLVSHVQLHHLEGEPARRAVVSGLTASASITTAACLIMTSVFASFVLNGDPTIKQFGVGLASAVLLAGLLVVTLAPASITLLGEAAWWLPRWLNRLLPHVNLEGEPEPVVPPTPVPDALLLAGADPQSLR